MNMFYLVSNEVSIPCPILTEKLNNFPVLKDMYLMT